MKNRPGFFKFFITEKSAVQMQIPIRFVERNGGSLPKKAFLRDGYNNMWQVKVAQVEGNWYFQNGWPEFVKDNMMNSCDFIVFDYIENDLFEFKILGPNGVETKGAGAFLPPDHHVDDENDSEGNDSVFKTRRQEAYANEEEDDDDDETEDADYLINNQDNIKDAIVEVNSGPACNIGRSSRNEIVSSPRYIGADIFEAGLAPLPKNPYFVMKAKKQRINDLFIPLPLINDHNLDLPIPEMLLVDPRGREFRAKYKRWKDGRILYCGGWRALCHMNLLNVGDHCICEFMKAGQGLYLSVSFVRTSNTN